jgi:hypothetical protein
MKKHATVKRTKKAFFMVSPPFIVKGCWGVTGSVRL